MIHIDDLGRAIHAAKRVGGPWGPACSHCVQDEDDPKFLGIIGEFLPVEYDEDDCGLFDCECKAMAGHLIELIGDAISHATTPETVGTNDA